ncbi:FUSC family protein [Roseomonas sp. E05]|uniref:FUSC family protein n=1 Tax=Roseomonas sp. E05 TaxID=3046310 RepID=UPI0024B8DA50|nr:FUSC family protein [Roseomonas sp. E05]MDJ0386941.1 FUSC family protein [Roseomonas sp. E05]
MPAGSGLWQAIRFAVQTVAAVLVSYGLATVLALPDVSWAIFSALFVIQSSIGGTVSAAADRMAGALLGAVMALACIFVIGIGEWRTVLALVAGVGAMALVAGARPQFSYGLVTVAILILAPGTQVVEDALLKVAAIALGSAAGALASVLVLPRRAHLAAEQHLARAVAGCGALLSACMAKMLARDAPDLRAVHASISDELTLAGKMSRQSRLRLRLGSEQRRPSELLRQVERLWYTLALVDRLSGEPLPEQARRLLAEPVRDAAREAEDFLRKTGDALARMQPPPPADRFHDRICAIAAAMDRLHREGGLTRQEAERTFGLSFAWEQVSHSVNELLALLPEQP